ncbi:hypothetical protein [Streptomyces sp. MST-110588]|uniref:hypothetical protein n=1 Tax=Streptomyces sp. MST-110588 TaxID=2833628 RepID=UPI001F5DE548|nr:hypothetical protein [Streptomyces sp. MST-110588]
MNTGSSRRGLVHAAAWTLATGVAVTLSWFGVRTVLAGTVYDPPRALPLSGAAPSVRTGTDDGNPPQASSTHRPKPSGQPTPSPSASAGPGASRPASPSHGAGGGGLGTDGASRTSSGGTLSPTTSGTVKNYATAGGRVVFDMGTRSAQLVSATPNSGWRMQVWEQNQWIRVEFTGNGAHTSVICTWNGHPPTVATDEHAT